MKKVLVALTAVAMLILLVGCGEVSSSGSAGEPDNAAPAAESVQEPSESEAVEEPAAEEPAEPEMTTNQEQAVESAQSYLATGSFSRKGLIEQLRFEEFSKAASHVRRRLHRPQLERAGRADRPELPRYGELLAQRAD